MLKLFRRKESLKKFFLGFILVFISAALVISLAPLPSATTGPTQLGTLAEYKGEEVTVLHLQRALDTQFRGSPLGREPAIRAQFAPRVLDELLFRYVGIDEARRLGLTVSNEELTAYLRTLPWLYPEGNFVGMDRYELIIQSQSRMTVAEFEAQMRESLLLDKLRWVASDGLEVSDAEVREEFHRRSDQVQIDYVLFDPSRYLQAVKIEAAQLEAYFAANQGKYSVREQRRLRYVLIEPDRVRADAEVSEEDIWAYYRSRLDEFRVQERAQVSHILFRTLGQSEEEAALAEQKANDVLKQARAGTEFAKLAEEHSEDATAAVGGDLGWVYRGQTVSEFEQAAFTLEPNTISDLIKTTYGFHILKVADRQKAHLETFDQVQDRLRPILEGQKRDAALGALANRVERALRARPTAFSEVAAELDLRVRETPLFRHGQAVTDLGTENNVHDLAFRLREGEVGTAVSVPKGRVIVQLIERLEEHLPTLDQVRARVEQDYRAGQSGVVARERAGELATQAAEVGDFKKAARSLRLRWTRSSLFARTQYLDDLGSAASLGPAFSLEEGEFSKVVEAGGNTVVFEVVKRQAADEAGLDEQREILREDLSARKRSLAYELHRQSLFRQLEITGELIRYPQAMATFLSSYQQ